MHDDLFAPEVIHDPYTYFGCLREQDPIHWNARDAAWLVTRYDDVVWLTRHPELFSSWLGAIGPCGAADTPAGSPVDGASHRSRWGNVDTP
jgi:cytochrome P450